MKMVKDYHIELMKSCTLHYYGKAEREIFIVSQGIQKNSPIAKTIESNWYSMKG
jgi:hypothetical protein